MLVIMSKDKNSFDLVKKQMGLELYNKINTGLVSKKEKLWLPKFKTTSEFELSEALQQMGMKEAFTDNADFSGMTGKKTLRSARSFIKHLLK